MTTKIFYQHSIVSIDKVLLIAFQEGFPNLFYALNTVKSSLHANDKHTHDVDGHSTARGAYIFVRTLPMMEFNVCSLALISDAIESNSCMIC